MPKLSALMRFLLRPYLLRAVEDGVDDEDGEQGGDEGGNDEPGADEDVDAAEQDGGDGSDDDDADADAEDGDDEADDPDGEGDDGLVVTLGEEPAPKDERAAPEWLRELRKSNRDKDRTIRELEAKIRSGQQPVQQVVVGPKPTLEACGYDEEKFAAELEAWHDRKTSADAETRKREDAEKQQREAWQRTQDAYAAAKGSLKVQNFEDAEETVKASFNETQQGILLVAMEPKKAALLVYALGSSPKKLKEVSAITDPIKFTVAITKLESEMKVSRTKTAPAPERKISGNVAGAAAVDSQIERLRNEARKTGDYSKVVEHNRRIAEKARVKQKA